MLEQDRQACEEIAARFNVMGAPGLSGDLNHPLLQYTKDRLLAGEGGELWVYANAVAGWSSVGYNSSIPWVDGSGDRFLRLDAQDHVDVHVPTSIVRDPASRGFVVNHLLDRYRMVADRALRGSLDDKRIRADGPAVPFDQFDPSGLPFSNNPNDPVFVYGSHCDQYEGAIRARVSEATGIPAGHISLGFLPGGHYRQEVVFFHPATRLVVPAIGSQAARVENYSGSEAKIPWIVGDRDHYDSSLRRFMVFRVWVSSRVFWNLDPTYEWNMQKLVSYDMKGVASGPYHP